MPGAATTAGRAAEHAVAATAPRRFAAQQYSEHFHPVGDLIDWDLVEVGRELDEIGVLARRR
jgi:hypothetical protein